MTEIEAANGREQSCCRLYFFAACSLYTGTMSILTIKAPAKINLHLRVKDLRPDGFHGIESIFTALDFGDILHFEPYGPEGTLNIKIHPDSSVFEAGQDPQQALPASENIIFRAVSLFRERSGFNTGLNIYLEKHIPLAGGLGGGSSDAASTLLALNALAAKALFCGHAPLADSALEELGAALGSDVPFFLKKYGAAWVSGRGELIQALSIPENLWIVLVKPGFSSNTREAYLLLDQYRKTAKTVPDTFTNDFLPVFLQDERVNTTYREILEDLKACGAEFSSLSGAGSTCFGVFADRDNAHRAYKTLLPKWSFVKVTVPLG